jgi:hypothetical protein
VLARLAEESITNAGLCLTDFAALEALLHKGPQPVSGANTVHTPGLAKHVLHRFREQDCVGDKAVFIIKPN